MSKYEIYIEKQHTLQKDKQLYYSNLLYKYKHNPKESWQTINRILGRGHNKSSISSIRQNDNIICGSNEIAETFNEYFSTIGDKIANSVDSGNTHFSSYISKSSTTFEFDTVSVDKVLHSFHALSSSKAIGVDKIPIKVLKLSIAIIAPSMTKLFNYAIQNGVFPRDWKVAKVIPLHKKVPKICWIIIAQSLSFQLSARPLKVYFMSNYMAIYPMLAYFRNVNSVSDDITLQLRLFLIALINGIQIWIKVCLILLLF